MLVLGIESSCDETGVALYCTNRGLLAERLHSQVALHTRYGGVVPELASRDHILRLLPLLDGCLADAGVTLDALDAIGYTRGPGLAGALLVGASVAGGLAWSLGLPVVGVHHLEGHLLSPLLADPAPAFPFVALLVSGGHTQLLKATALGDYTLLGETVDDAAGEAFDKSAKLLGLGYPGGPALSKLAQQGNAGVFDLPRPKRHSPDLDFSFSGLKTAVRQCVDAGLADDQARADLAFAVEDAITDVLVSKAVAACHQTGLNRLVISGGVSANRVLRERLDAATGIAVFTPPQRLCTDNGAMIALTAALHLKADPGCAQPAGALPDVLPRWPLTDRIRG